MKKTYVVSGNPVPQGRPRAFTRPGMKGVRFYDPKKSVNWKAEIRDQVHRQAPEALSGPVCLAMWFWIAPPKVAKTGDSHIKKPDLDNLVKAVKDALKGLCWKDDSQVVQIMAQKGYAFNREPCVVFEVGNYAEISCAGR